MSTKRSCLYLKKACWSRRLREVRASTPACIRVNTVTMKRQTVITRKRRGPAPTGKGILIGVRFQPKQLENLDRWTAQSAPGESRPEAVRRLVEVGLTANAAPKQSSDSQKSRAKQMAGGAIDKMADSSATADDQENRKRRLLKGPEEFRDVRVDRKTKK